MTSFRFHVFRVGGLLAAWALPTVIFGQAVPSLPAPDSEEAKWLEQLQKIEETVSKARSGNNMAAVDVIREAASSEAKAIDLWMDSVRDADFRGKDKKDAEWRQWRDGAARRLQAPGGGASLRLHFQYLLLTIKASAARTDEERAAVIGDLFSYLDDLARGGKDMLANRQALDQAVLGTPVARRFKLDATVTPPDGWSPLPGDIGTIYESTILPFYRAKKDAARLQSAWTKRVQQEAALAAAADSEFQVKFFREVTQPRLEWGMARDMFLAGNRQAGGKMLMVINQNPAHKEAPAWAKELRDLLTRPPEPAPVTAATPPPEAPDASAEPAEVPKDESREATVPEPTPTSTVRRPPPAAFPPNLRSGR
jgi:hypothetical protein